MRQMTFTIRVPQVNWRFVRRWAWLLALGAALLTLAKVISIQWAEHGALAGWMLGALWQTVVFSTRPEQR